MTSLYHVYADNFDHFTRCFVEAATTTNRLIDEGRENVRLSREDYDDDVLDGAVYDERVLIAHGDFPL